LKTLNSSFQAEEIKKSIDPMNFKLKARVNRSDAQTIRQALDQLAARGSVRKEGDGFLVEAEMEGASAKELNRTLLSALRKVEKRTTLRAQWTSGETTERYFDYVLKKTIKG
jgi:DNA-binding GntR family transcriptional regulator